MILLFPYHSRMTPAKSAARPMPPMVNMTGLPRSSMLKHPAVFWNKSTQSGRVFLFDVGLSWTHLENWKSFKHLRLLILVIDQWFENQSWQSGLPFYWNLPFSIDFCKNIVTFTYFFFIFLWQRNQKALHSWTVWWASNFSDQLTTKM